jgi:hypothetical protein
MKLRVPHWVALSVLTAAAVAACTDQSPVTGPLSPRAASRDVSADVVGTSFTLCTGTGAVATTVQKSFNLGVTYGASAAVLNATGNQGVWHAPIPGSDWVKAPGDAAAPFTNYGVNAPDNVFTKFTTAFTVPAGTTATVTGSSFVDNQVLSIQIDGAGASLGANPLLDGAASVVNYAGPAPLAWTPSGPIAAGNHTVVVTARNNDDIQPTNPTAVDYCFTVTTTPVALALFVIGDVEPHAVGDIVNFWGAQWWKNNQMSGVTDNGYQSFKGFAINSTNVCGGTWESLPGNSSNPPDAPLPANIRIIVTSKVIKDGPNLSGDIVQIVNVHQDGNYDSNPGHKAFGTVISVACP